MKHIKANKLILLIFILVMGFAVQGSFAFAQGPIETGRDVDLTISYADEGLALEGAVFDFYRCADVDETAGMTLAKDFASYDVDLEGMDHDGWQELALTLKGFAQRDKLTPLASETTDASGNINITLKPGLYLVAGHQVKAGGFMYSATPYMLFLPERSEISNEWNYALTSYPKHGKTELPSLTSVKVLKIWKDEGFEKDRPAGVTVDLLENGACCDTQTLSAENNWNYTWKDLDAGSDWMVVEREVGNYTPKVMKDGQTFTITNTHKAYSVIVDPPVVKRISGGTPENDSTFTFCLLAADASCPMPEGSDGDSKTITITGCGAEEFGEIQFVTPGEYVYTVYEKGENITGYTFDDIVYTIKYTVTQGVGRFNIQRVITTQSGSEADSLTFTNRYSKPGTKLPQTGLLWWPVIACICVGLLFYIIGFTWKKKV